MWKNILSILLILILVFIFLFLLTYTKGNNNEIVKSVESPNEKYVAYLFIRDLGATTKASYHLSILEQGKKLSNKSGNIFISYEKFDIKWNSSKELIIKLSKNQKFFKKETNYEDIKIKYLME